jgi:hypothetical protein
LTGVTRACGLLASKVNLKPEFRSPTARAWRSDRGRKTFGGEEENIKFRQLCSTAKVSSWGARLKWLSTKIVHRGDPRPDILSPWRQLLSLPIPCHDVHQQTPESALRAAAAARPTTRRFQSIPRNPHAMEAGTTRLRGRPHRMLSMRGVLDCAAAWTRLGGV